MENYGIRKSNIETLAKLLFDRKKTGRMPVLLIGSGVSIESGGPDGYGLMESILRSYPPTEKDWIDVIKDFTPGIKEHDTSSLIRDFTDYLNRLSSGKKLTDQKNINYYYELVSSLYNLTISRRSIQEIYGIYHEYLQYHRPSIGYEYFGKLAKKGYFEWIVSTNFDPLVEEAFADAKIPQHDMILLTRKMSDPNEIALFIKSDFHNPPLKLFKIHGDLRTRKIDATSETIQRFDQETEIELEKNLVSLVNRRDLVVIGHSLRDNNINKIISKACISENHVNKLNSIWLLTMPEHEVLSNASLKKIDSEYKDRKSGGINYILDDETEKRKTITTEHPTIAMK
ncbi:SIR2 family protein [Pararhodospirillum photometricum]|uniref:SIR2 family protein n=1 Tax=Pararhodospirillum photometricum TaxID=1084 RepID=UPI0012FE8DE8|nr:SIR2 family protein [Pararhodospirillum photometricum]